MRAGVKRAKKLEFFSKSGVNFETLVFASGHHIVDILHEGQAILGLMA